MEFRDHGWEGFLMGSISKSSLIFSILLFCTPCPPAQAQSIITRPIGDCKLVFNDDFNGSALDTSLWHYRTDSKLLSTQLPENVTVAGGQLHLNIRKQNARGMQYTGAGVISKKEFRYGYYESRFRTPPAIGWHTSFWVMKYSGSGGTDTPTAFQEIDICENDSKYKTKYGTNLHNWNGVHIETGGKTIATPDLSADFHVFGCDFSPTEVSYYFDGKLVNVIDATKRKHSDASIWLTTIASAAGGFDVDQTALPSEAIYDYARFYELIDPKFPDTTRTDSVIVPGSGTPRILVDNGDPGFSVDAPWTASTFTAGYQGKDYLTDGTAGPDSGRWAKWTPVIPKTANYRIFIRWTAGENRPVAAPVEIRNANGDTTLHVDQTKNNGTWVFLGNYLLNQGSLDFVKLEATSAGITVADAVLFEEQTVSTHVVEKKTRPGRAFPWVDGLFRNFDMRGRFLGP